MSVVNRMLQDLDERRVRLADTVFDAEPPVSIALVPRSRNLPRALAALSVMIAVLGAAKAWTWMNETAAEPPARDVSAPWAQAGAWVESAAIDAWMREQAPVALSARKGTTGARVAPAADEARARAAGSQDFAAHAQAARDERAREARAGAPEVPAAGAQANPGQANPAQANPAQANPAQANAAQSNGTPSAGGATAPATDLASRKPDAQTASERPADTVVAGVRIDAAQERDAKVSKAAAATGGARAASAADAAKIERSNRTAGVDSGPEAAYRQGLARYNAGDFAAAVQLLRIALAEDPRFAAARRALAALYVDRRDWPQAQSVLAEGLAIDPRNAQFAQLSAQISTRAGDPDAAIRTLQAAAGESSPAELNATLAGLLARARRDREAVPYWMAALKRSPMQGEWWLGLAIALEADARPGDARPAYERALALGRLAAESADFARERLANLR